MLTLLHPAALIGLTLLGIPIVLHLFKPRKVRVVAFSSLRWMRSSQHRLSRRIQWHQVLLFLLRAAFLALLVLALARPTFWLSFSGSKPTARFVLVDVSRSMNYRPTSRPAPIQSAVEVARRAMGQSGPAARTSVIIAGAPPRAMGPLTTDPTAYDKQLPGVHADQATASLGDALPVVAAMLRDAGPDEQVQLLCVTDNRQDTWSQAAIASFLNGVGRPVSVKVIDVGPFEPQNAWIVSAQTLDEKRQVVRVRLSCQSTQSIKRLIKAFVDDSEAAVAEEQVVIEPGKTAEVLLAIPPQAASSASTLRLELSPHDGLSDDDAYWLNLGDRAEASVLIIQPDATRPGGVEPGVHLRTVLDALRTAGSLVAPTLKSVAQVTSSDVERADVVFLVDAARLSPDLVAALRKHVHGGAGLAIFLGPTTDAGYFNTQFPELAKLGEINQSPTQAGNVAHLTGVKWDDPLFAGLGDPLFSDLRRVGVRTFMNLTAADGVQTLATIDNATAAVLERSVGTGRMLLFNLSADDAWSDLPRRQSFVPLVDHVLSRLAGESHRGDFNVGRPIVLPLTDADVSKNVTLVWPSGRSVRAALRPLAGGSALWIDNPQEPGVYQVRYRTSVGQERKVRFIVQVDRLESALTPADADALHAWWGRDACQIIRADDLADSVLRQVPSVDLTPWAVVLACLALLAEMYLVHSLCPAVNREIASSVVVGSGRIAAASPSEGATTT